MSGRNRAAIDVGSNTLLLTVVDATGRVLHDEARVVGLGAGLGDRGMLRPDRMAAAEVVLRAYAATAAAHGVEPRDVRAVATSAARRALNAETYFERVHRDCGLRVRIVSGEEEARLTWIGGLVDLPGDGDLLVVDIGGGSTEVVQGRAGSIHDRVSLEIGSVRLTERHLSDRGGIADRFDPAGFADLERHVASELDRVRIDPAPTLGIGVAGTVTTLMAMALGLDQWDATRVHGAALTSTHLETFRDRLRTADRAERARLARVSPERADYLLAGTAILLPLLHRCGLSAWVVSDRGLRYGLLA